MHFKYPYAIGLVIACFVVVLPVAAQENSEKKTEQDESSLGWANSSELSLVVTSGNSDTETLGFKNTLRYHWPKARYTLRLDALRSSNADDKFVEVLPYFEGAEIEDLVRVVEPEKKLDVEKYLISTGYDRQVSDRFFWNLGLTWDRNEDAGILNRYLAFFGLGNIWSDRDDLRFETSYGLSYTDREEETPDPEKDDAFPGLRTAARFSSKWGKVTTFGNHSIFNVNLSDAGDWSSDMTTWLAVAINNRLALKVSLQWLFNSRPALLEIDVVAKTPEGIEIDFGNVNIRKEKLDTVLTTALVVDF
jgi:putative salt-induced outer membrane protein YdiY